MIHKVFIDSTSTPESLRKEGRKKAMTGGVVVRIPSEVGADELEEIISVFEPVAEENNLAVEVLRQAAAHPCLSIQGRAKLLASPIQSVRAVLLRR